ncbi:hypothetical protein CISG_08348 [Coccidioides immitis RMSCC 3703]|uniref:Uncharacterized protein n=1 Tax=Coccidioides immitis RMSCC 3703 TaxID=454286 RepID=A0A0J8U1F6_COCIT|nr:hypothetical protein CISG_08348 [Coccidioides immitis RMSCC 3703]
MGQPQYMTANAMAVQMLSMSLQHHLQSSKECHCSHPCVIITVSLQYLQQTHQHRSNNKPPLKMPMHMTTTLKKRAVKKLALVLSKQLMKRVAGSLDKQVTHAYARQVTLRYPQRRQ